MARNWEYTGDVNMLNYGGTFIRHIKDGIFHVIQFDNLDECCGRDNDGHPKYHLSLREVNTHDVEAVAEALRYCGVEAEEIGDFWKAEALSSYGRYAPLENQATNNAHKTLREFKALSRSISNDAKEHRRRMNKPVNRLGSTAKEYQSGDFKSALVRGIIKGEQNALIIGKMYAACAPPS